MVLRVVLVQIPLGLRPFLRDVRNKPVTFPRQDTGEVGDFAISPRDKSDRDFRPSIF